MKSYGMAKKQFFCLSPMRKAAITHGDPRADHLVSHHRLEKRFFLSLKKQTVAFLSTDSTVCTYLFSLPSLFFPHSQSIPHGITVLFHGNCLMRAGVAASRRWLPDRAGLGCSWLLVLMWSDRASEAKETTEECSTFHSFPRSYQVNRRLKTKQKKKKKKIHC